MVKVLMVEPGSKASVTARLRSSWPPWTALGLTGGSLAMASTSPVAGSSATATPESAREPRTAAARARSVASCSPWSMVSSTRAPFAAARRARGVLQRQPPGAVAQRGDAGRLAAQQVVERQLHAVEARALVAGDAEQLPGQRELRVVAPGLGHQADAGEARAGAPRRPRPARCAAWPRRSATPRSTFFAKRLASRGRARRPAAGAPGASRPPGRPALGIDEDRLGVGAAGQQHAGPVGHHAAARLHHELAQVLVAGLGGELVALHHLQLHGAPGQAAEAGQEERARPARCGSAIQRVALGSGPGRMGQCPGRGHPRRPPERDLLRPGDLRVPPGVRRRRAGTRRRPSTAGLHRQPRRGRLHRESPRRARVEPSRAWSSRTSPAPPAP